MIDLAGIKTDFVRFAKSLLPLLSNDPNKEEEEAMSRFVYSEGGFFFHSELFPGGSDHVPDNPKGMYWPRAQEEMSNNGTGSPKWVMIRNLTAKLVYRPLGISELYDLTKDPRELENLYNSPIEKYIVLRNELKTKLIESFCIRRFKQIKSNHKQLIINNYKSKCFSAIYITSSPIAKQAVAAGEGAFKT